MKNIVALAIMVSSFASYAMPTHKFITIDRKTYESISTELSYPTHSLAQNGSIVVLRLNLEQIEEVSHKIHSKLRRCGGFTAHDSFNEANGLISKKSKTLSFNLFDYSIDQKPIIDSMLTQISEVEIKNMILALSGFETRHYQSESGAESSRLIHDTWKKLSHHRSDVTIEFVQHEQWHQPSVILTINGSEKPEEIVILGGHSDSIAMDGEIAPGADDNASGISSVTEVLRLLMVNNFRPKRTIQFMAYAAEEVGLLGSGDIAKSYRKDAKEVVGVMQLDMTLFKGTPDKDILLISDFTSKAQNNFLGKLIDEYVKVPWGYSRCGYGCSDHASWSSMGYAASFPFETTMSEHNPNIHTHMDTLENAGGTADHAVNFTKLATAFVVEMSN